MINELDFEMNYYTLKNRRKKGQDLSKEVKKYNFNKKDKLGLNPKEQLEFCKKAGIRHSLYVKRKEKGWTLEEIAETPPYDTRLKYQLIDRLMLEKQIVRFTGKVTASYRINDMHTKVKTPMKYAKLEHMAHETNLYQNEKGQVVRSDDED